MIPVSPQPEPKSFDESVRKPGREYLRLHPEARASELPAYWTKVGYDLWEKYEGICAYLAVFIDYPTGGTTTDHFAAKSKSKDLAYEWDNYRLSCLGANQKKHTHEVLDPFVMKKESFFICFADGGMYPNPQMGEPYRKLCKRTIDLLQLNSAYCKHMRRSHYDDFQGGHIDLDYLRRKSPFVWTEINRQKLHVEAWKDS